MSRLKITRLITLFVILLAVVVALPVETAKAESLVFSDDFSADLEKWLPTRDAGQFWQIREGRVEATVPYGSTITELVPKDHYWDSRWQAIRFEFDFTALAGVDRNLSFGVIDPCNWYETHFVDGLVDLARLLNCQVSFGQQFTFELQQNQTYHIAITFNDGLIQMFIDEQLLFATQDPSFNHNYGKIGLKAGTGSVYPTRVAFDNVKVSLLDSGLGVTLLKQTDSRWGEHLYDSADRWSSQPTISRWGCALVSMVMLLNYHGLNTFGDGSPITPLTLNTWLNNQPDGYIGEGMVNWLAVTRLTFELSKVFSTPKLEYAMYKENLLPKVIEEINQIQPVILQIDGHFLVADGINQLQNDLLIKDPAYAHTYFSQHQTDLVSVRTFQPSQTDLSYLMVAHSPELNVNLQLMDEGSSVNVIHTIESLRPPQSENIKPTSLAQVLLPKPPTGEYQISISQAALGPFSMDIFVYDQEGTPTQFEVSGIVGYYQKTYQLKYYSETNLSLDPSLNWAQYRQDIHQVRKEGGFWGWPIYWLLEWTVYQAQEKQLPYDPEILKIIALQLSNYRPWMTEPSYRYLAQQLNSLGP